MKLREGVILQKVLRSRLAVTTGDAAADFHGMVKANETADRVLHLLQEDTTRDRIVDTIFAEYDAPRQVIEKDVDALLDALRDHGMLQ